MTKNKCKRCETREAEAPNLSVFLLCEECADELYPGPNVERYWELFTLYGH